MLNVASHYKLATTNLHAIYLNANFRKVITRPSPPNLNPLSERATREHTSTILARGVSGSLKILKFGGKGITT